MPYFTAMGTLLNFVVILTILSLCLKLKPTHCQPDTSLPLGNIAISSELARLPDKLCFVWISTRDTKLRSFNLPKYYRYGMDLRIANVSNHVLISILLAGDIATNPGPAHVNNNSPTYLGGLNVLYMNARSIKAFVPLVENPSSKVCKITLIQQLVYSNCNDLSVYVKPG